MVYQQLARAAVRRYGPRIVRWGAKKALSKFRAYRSKRIKKSGGGKKESPLLTYDNDFKTDYKYKRMPRRKRRRWKRFVNKVHGIARRDQGLKQYLVEECFRTHELQPFCNFGQALLYTPDARLATLNADMGNIFRNILGNVEFDQINSLVSADVDKKIYFESAQLDLSWRNIGENPMIIDLYKVVCRKDFGLTNLDNYNDVVGLYRLGFVKQGQIIDEEDGNTVGDAKQDALNPGTTPFQSSLFCQHFRILQKRRITIAPGNTVSVTLKDSKNRLINANEQRAHICKRGQTFGYIWQSMGVPGIVEAQVVHSLPHDYVTSVIKKYGFYLPVSGKNQTSIEFT